MLTRANFINLLPTGFEDFPRFNTGDRNLYGADKRDVKAHFAERSASPSGRQVRGPGRP